MDTGSFLTSHLFAATEEGQALVSLPGIPARREETAAEDLPQAESSGLYSSAADLPMCHPLPADTFTDDGCLIGEYSGLTSSLSLKLSLLLSVYLQEVCN